MKKNTVRAALAAVVALGSIACGDDPLGVPRDTAASIQTDELEYDLNRRGLFLEGAIDYAYENTTAAPLYIQNCGGAYNLVLQQFRDDAWHDVWGPPTPDCISPALEIAPGASLSDRLVISAGSPRCECGGFATPEIDGIYRIVVLDTFDSVGPDGFATGQLVAVDLRTSNRFVITD